MTFLRCQFILSPYGLTAIHPRPIEVGVFLPIQDKKLEAVAQQSEQNHRKELDTALRLQKAELTEQFNQKSEQTQAQHTAQITALLESMNKQNAKEE